MQWKRDFSFMVVSGLPGVLVLNFQTKFSKLDRNPYHGPLESSALSSTNY